MAILQSLMQMIDPADALVFEKYYGSALASDFIEGMEHVARAIMEDMAQDELLKPMTAPWDDIYAFLLIDDAPDIKARFDRSLLAYPEDDRRQAIKNAIERRVQDNMVWKRQQAQANGVKHKYTSDYILRTLTKMGYKFRLNLCDDHVEVNGLPLNDFQMMEIRRRCRDIGVKDLRAVEDTYMSDAAKNAYHPVKEYLYACKYDSQIDYIGELASHFTDDYGMFETWLRKWMIGAVAKVLGNHQNRMLILDGPQDVGKSFFAHWLAGGLPNYFYEGAIDTYNRRDTEVLLMNTWIWEVSELGGTFARAELNALKAFLTQQNVKVRKAYGRQETQKPAMASFIGTVNNEAGILNDYTGSRRYFISKITAIDRSYTKLRVDDVWAQAMYLYQSGEKWGLDDDERALANEINEIYTIEDITQSYLLQYFDIDKTRLDWFTPTMLIVKRCEEKGLKLGNSHATTIAIGRALAALGLPKIRSRTSTQRMNGYKGILPNLTP